MKVKIKYGNGKKELEVPDKNYIGKIVPEQVTPLENPKKEVNLSLEEPISSPRLSEIVNSDEEVVILASDISRPAPSNLLLPPIVKELNNGGVKDENIKIVFGLGVHRKQTEEEKKNLIGEELYVRLKCIDHDINRCEHIGTTERGTDVEVFEEVLNADRVVATGNLEYHYFAGFSGGAKAVAPGVCSRKTIMQNHQKFLDPMAKSGLIEGNPIREEIEEMGEMVGIDFIVNAVLNSAKEMIAVVAGDVTEAHRVGKAHIEDIYEVSIDEPADIVITSPGGAPKDLDLYQTHKSMEHAVEAIKDGGKMIVVGKCSDGLGEDNFAEAMTEDNFPDELIEELKSKFVLGRHKASRVAMIHKNSEISLVSSLPAKTEEKLFINCYDDVNDALDDALEKEGREARVLIMPHGSSTLPRFH